MRAGLILAALAPLCLLAGGATGAMQQDPEGPLLAAITVNGTEVAVIDIVRDGGELWLPLDQVARWIWSPLRHENNRTTFDTPLGPVAVPQEDLRSFDGVSHVRSSLLSREMLAKTSFDARALRLSVEVPWKGPRSAVVRESVVPDVRAPSAALSLFRLDVSHQRTGDVGRWLSTTEAAGRLAGGRFRLRYSSDFDSAGTFEDAVWSRTAGRTMIVAGQQPVLVTPLLDSGKFTGIQAAYSNEPARVFPRDTDTRELLPRRISPTRTFRGAGPPAGRADLYIDGVRTASMSIALDGLWEFAEVELPSRVGVRVEVHLFNRDNFVVPVAVQDQEVVASDLLLPVGAVIAVGGAGAAGDLLTEAFGGPRGGEGGIGFGSARAGVSERLTLEAAARLDAVGYQATGGVVALLAENATVSATAGVGNGSFGYRTELSWLGRKHRVVGYSQARQAGFAGTGREKDEDHFFEAAYRPSRALEVGVVGRRWAFGDQSPIEFVRPEIAVTPVAGVTARMRPDFDGVLRYDLFAMIGRRTSLSATYRDYLTADLTSQLRPKWRLSLGTEVGGTQATRLSAILHRAGTDRFSPELSAGTIVSGSHWGLYAGAYVPVLPGLYLRGEFQSVPLSREEGAKASPYLLVGLSTSLSLAGGRVVPADGGIWMAGQGALAGRLLVEGGPNGWKLGGIGILIDGTVRARVLPGGSFFVGNLPQGVYVVEVEDGTLPIELVPVKSSVKVEVVSGAVSRVDLQVHPQFSVSGRISCGTNGPLQGATVELLDRAGAVLGTALSDSFGLYRIDGARPGTHTLRVWRAGKTGEPATRSVSVTTDFLFGIDVTLSCPPASPTSVETSPD